MNMLLDNKETINSCQPQLL